MKRILELFDKINPEKLSLFTEEEGNISENIILHNIVESDFALIGMNESANKIRKEFYKLKQHNTTLKIIDLGNLKKGQTPRDTYFALGEVCSTLFQYQIIPIIIGGTHDNAIGIYKGYETISQIINIVNIDSHIDLKDIEKEPKNDNFLAHLFCSDPNYLFNYTHLAYQTYFVHNSVLKLFQDLRFEAYRLGEIQSEIEKSEPLIRNCDMLIADINAIRASDSPASRSPHGLYGEEFCKLLHYAGANDKLTSLGLFNYDAEKDPLSLTAQLLSHAIWYFIDGYLWRKNDFPYRDLNSYYRFNVLMENEETLVFFKSKKSGRWWLQINCSDESKQKYSRHYLIPCTYEDYQEAMKNKIPDRFILAHNKLNL